MPNAIFHVSGQQRVAAAQSLLWACPNRARGFPLPDAHREGGAPTQNANSPSESGRLALNWPEAANEKAVAARVASAFALPSFAFFLWVSTNGQRFLAKGSRAFPKALNPPVFWTKDPAGLFPLPLMAIFSVHILLRHFPKIAIFPRNFTVLSLYQNVHLHVHLHSQYRMNFTNSK